MEYNDKGGAGQYWFFRFDDGIMFSYDFRKMENLPGGYEFIVILLKLYSISTKTKGVFRIEANADGSMNTIDFAAVLNHKARVFEEAMKYFIEQGLIKALRCDETEFIFTVPAVVNKIGKSTSQADYMRGYRNGIGGKGVQQLPESMEVNEATKPSEPEPEYDLYGILKNVRLTDKEIKDFCKRYENAEDVIDKLSIYKGKKGGDLGGNDYAWLLSFAQDDGKPKEKDSEKRYSIYERYKREALAGCPPPDKVRNELTQMQFEELQRIADEAWEKENSQGVQINFNIRQSDEESET